MPTVGFEPTISAGERPQTYVLEGAATGTGLTQLCVYLLCKDKLKILVLPDDHHAIRKLIKNGNIYIYISYIFTFFLRLYMQPNDSPIRSKHET